jgi:hypothetical protein
MGGAFKGKSADDAVTAVIATAEIARISLFMKRPFKWMPSKLAKSYDERGPEAVAHSQQQYPKFSILTGNRIQWPSRRKERILKRKLKRDE